MTKILFISNGHGEDLNASLIAEALKNLHSECDISAFPIVGEGMTYRNKHIEVVAPTKTMPSGGFFYLNFLNLLKDLTSGLILLTIRQIKIILQQGKEFDLLFAVGDIVPIFFAYITQQKFMAFIVSTSAFYGGYIKLPFMTQFFLKSKRCLKIFTRDEFTAEQLQNQGFSKAVFSGYPIMDTLKPSGKDLHLYPEYPTIALLPGSRVPEALRNLELELKVCEELMLLSTIRFNFQTALVSTITEDDLKNISEKQNWQYLENGVLEKKINDRTLTIRCHKNAFSEILNTSDLILGMAGTAIEQAVGLGKPVVQIIGDGPQFTYRFAEAQMQLLGLNVSTIKSGQFMCQEASQKILSILSDKDYLEQCKINGKTRVGGAGASAKIAEKIIKILS